MSKDRPWGNGTPTWVRDVTINDSDKTFVTPSGKVREILGISATLQCTAAVGSRSLCVFLYDTAPAILWRTVGAALIASQNGTLIVGFGSFVPVMASVGKEVNTNGVPINAGVQEAAPRCILPAGYSVRVWDTAAIDAAADDLTVVLHYVEYDA